MSEITIRVLPHWFNGWFLRMLSQPYLVVDDRRQRVRWGKTTVVNTQAAQITVGAGVRYLGRGHLLGLEPQVVQLADGRDGSPAPMSATSLVLRNGLLNHTPFRLEREPARPGA